MSRAHSPSSQLSTPSQSPESSPNRLHAEEKQQSTDDNNVEDDDLLLPEQKDAIFFNSINGGMKKKETIYVSSIDSATSKVNSLLSISAQQVEESTTSLVSDFRSDFQRSMDQCRDKIYKYLEIHQLPSQQRLEVKHRQDKLKESILTSLSTFESSNSFRASKALEGGRESTLKVFDSALEHHSSELKSRVRWMQDKFKAKLSETRTAHSAELKDTIALDKALMNEMVDGMRKEREREFGAIREKIEEQLRIENKEKQENFNTLSEVKLKKLQNIIQNLQIEKETLIMANQGIKKESAMQRDEMDKKDGTIKQLMDEMRTLKDGYRKCREDLREQKKLLIMATTSTTNEDDPSIVTNSSSRTGVSSRRSKRSMRSHSTNGSSAISSKQSKISTTNITLEEESIDSNPSGKRRANKARTWGKIGRSHAEPPKAVVNSHTNEGVQNSDSPTELVLSPRIQSPESQLYSLSSSSLEMENFDEFSDNSSVISNLTPLARANPIHADASHREGANVDIKREKTMNTTDIDNLHSKKMNDRESDALLDEPLARGGIGNIEGMANCDAAANPNQQPASGGGDASSSYEKIQIHAQQQIHSPQKFKTHEFETEDVNLLRIRLDSDSDLLASMTGEPEGQPILQGQMHTRPKNKNSVDAASSAPAPETAIITSPAKEAESEAASPENKRDLSDHYHPKRMGHSHSYYQRQNRKEIDLEYLGIDSDEKEESGALQLDSNVVADEEYRQRELDKRRQSSHAHPHAKNHRHDMAAQAAPNPPAINGSDSVGVIRESVTTPEILALSSFNELFERQHASSKQLVEGFHQQQVERREMVVRNEEGREFAGNDEIAIGREGSFLSDPKQIMVKQNAQTEKIDHLTTLLLEKDELLAKLVVKLRTSDMDRESLRRDMEKLKLSLQRKQFPTYSVVTGHKQQRPKTSGGTGRVGRSEMMEARPKSAGSANIEQQHQGNGLIKGQRRLFFNLDSENKSKNADAILNKNRRNLKKVSQSTYILMMMMVCVRNRFV